MKALYRKGLGAVVLLAAAAVWIVSSSLSVRLRRTHTCTGKETLDVRVLDSLERRFVNKADVESWLDNEYRAYAGMRLDSVDLKKIEQIVSSHSAVRQAEAWLTDDGSLHVALTQRQPVVRFQNGQNGYYADASGFLFPLQRRASVEVPVVDGALPLKVPKGFKGEPATDAEKAWLKAILDMITYMDGTVWSDNISQITADEGGNLVLIPREGKERFLFGRPERVREKFSLMDAYYESVRPAREADYYRTVDVRYRKQLVCRK